MPELDGKKYSYDKEGKKDFMKALKEKKEKAKAIQKKVGKAVKDKKAKTIQKKVGKAIKDKEDTAPRNYYPPQSALAEAESAPKTSKGRRYSKPDPRKRGIKGRPTRSNPSRGLTRKTERRYKKRSL